MSHRLKKKNNCSGFLLFLLLVVVAVFVVLNVDYFKPFVGIERIAPRPLEYKVRPVKSFTFSGPDALKEWEEKAFKGKVIYKLEKDEDSYHVRAISNGSASALYYKIKMNAKTMRPVVNWDWKVYKFPVKNNPESLEVENEDDFAARLYVIFPAVFFTNSKVLEYVWAKDLPVGTVGTSPYSDNIKLIVLRSGFDKDVSWRSEERDVRADYIKLFGKAPEYDMGVVAFMTNSEHTLTNAEATYDNIKVGYMEDADSKGGNK